jgi:DNA-binding transcriptional LysR family regulator
LPVAAAAFRRAYPRVTLALTCAEPVEALHGLRSGVYDIAVTLAEDEHLDTPCRSTVGDDVRRQPLLMDSFRVVLPLAHPLAARTTIPIAELADQTWISTSAPAHPDSDTLTRACAAAGFVPHIAFHIDDYQAVQGFIAAEVGISLIPHLALVAVRTDVAVRSVTPEPRRYVEAATIATRRPAPATTAVLEALHSDAASLPATVRSGLNQSETQATSTVE